MCEHSILDMSNQYKTTQLTSYILSKLHMHVCLSKLLFALLYPSGNIQMARTLVIFSEVLSFIFLLHYDLLYNNTYLQGVLSVLLPFFLFSSQNLYLPPQKVQTNKFVWMLSLFCTDVFL